MNDAPLTPGELMARLNMSAPTFYRYQRAGQFKHLELLRPVGMKRYSSVELAKYLARESTVKLGKRRAS